MKKLLFGALLTLLCITGKAMPILTLTNHSLCDVFVEIKAQDPTIGYGPCTLESYIFVVPPGPPMVFVGLPSVTSYCGWLSGVPTPLGWFNAVKFFYAGGCGGWVGDVVSCGAPMQWSGNCCATASGGLGFNWAVWTPMGGGNVNVDWY